MTPDIPSLRGELFVVSPADGRLCPVWLERHEEGSKVALLVLGSFGDVSVNVPIIYRPLTGTSEEAQRSVRWWLKKAGYYRIITEETQ